VILVGLKPGPHQVLFELANPTHKVITSQIVNFTVPDHVGAGRFFSENEGKPAV